MSNTSYKKSFDDDYQTIHDWLAKKPHALTTIAKHQIAKHQTIDAAHIPEVTTTIEQQYQKKLAQESKHIEQLYSGLTLDKKTELLALSKSISKVNAHILENAKKTLEHQAIVNQTERERASHPNVLPRVEQIPLSASNITPPVTEPAATFTTTSVQPAKPTQVEASAKSCVSDIGEELPVGNPFAVTINFPLGWAISKYSGTPSSGATGLFRNIAPQANQLVDKFLHKIPQLDNWSKKLGADKTGSLMSDQTNFDIGVAVKLVMRAERSADGSCGNLSYNVRYAGIGIMNNRQNIAISPGALQLEDSHLTGPGYYNTVLTKVTGDHSRTKISWAGGFQPETHEFNNVANAAYEKTKQKPNSRPVALFSVGWHFHDFEVAQVPQKYWNFLNNYWNELTLPKDIIARFDALSEFNDYMLSGSTVEQIAHQKEYGNFLENHKNLGVYEGPIQFMEHIQNTPPDITMDVDIGR